MEFNIKVEMDDILLKRLFLYEMKSKCLSGKCSEGVTKAGDNACSKVQGSAVPTIIMNQAMNCPANFVNVLLI